MSIKPRPETFSKSFVLEPVMSPKQINFVFKFFYPKAIFGAQKSDKSMAKAPQAG